MSRSTSPTAAATESGSSPFASFSAEQPHGRPRPRGRLAAGCAAVSDGASSEQRVGGRPREGGGVVVLQSRTMRAAITRKRGLLTELSRNGRRALLGGPRLQLWRAPTDNDGLRLLPDHDSGVLAGWLALGSRPPGAQTGEHRRAEGSRRGRASSLRAATLGRRAPPSGVPARRPRTRDRERRPGRP